MHTSLGPGDVLWLPKFWWHRVSAPSNAPNLSVNIWLCATGPKPPRHEVLSTRGVSQPRATEAFWVGKDGAKAVAAEVKTLVGTSDDDEVAVIGNGDEKDDEPKDDGLLPDGRLALTHLHAARMCECAATIVCGSSVLGGRFLRAVADEADSRWPTDGGAACFARKVRAELAAALGESNGTDDKLTVDMMSSARRLLRLITRHGRLAPGLVQPIDGPITSCEPLPPPKVFAILRSTSSPPDTSSLLHTSPIDDVAGTTDVL